MFWGHPLSIIVVGKNKIVENLDKAFQLLRNVIAPNHIYLRAAKAGGKKAQTPCAKTGVCSGCRSNDRRCSGFSIFEKNCYQHYHCWCRFGHRMEHILAPITYPGYQRKLQKICAYNTITATRIVAKCIRSHTNQEILPSQWATYKSAICFSSLCISE